MARAMFQGSLSKRNAAMAGNSLRVAPMIEKGVWNVCNETVGTPQIKIEAHLRSLSRTVSNDNCNTSLYVSIFLSINKIHNRLKFLKYKYEKNRSSASV